MHKSKQLIVGVCKYGFAFGLLAFVIWRYWSPAPPAVGLSEILQRPVQWGSLASAVAICAVAILLTFTRWYFLVRAQEMTFAPLDALRLGMIGLFWSTFFPGSVGGDIVKAVYIAREQQLRTRAVATVIVDRVVGLWGLVWLSASLGCYFWLAGNPAIMGEPDLTSLSFGLDYFRQAPLKTIVCGMVGLVTLSTSSWFVLVLLPPQKAERLARKLGRVPKIGVALAELWQAVWMYRSKQRTIWLTLFIAVLGHFGFVLTFYLSAQVFLEPGKSGQIPSLAEHFLVVPIAMTLQALVPLPGGLGFGEMVYGWLYQLVGKDFAAGLAGALAQRIVMWGLAFLGYFIYLGMPQRVSEDEMEAAEHGLADVSLEPAAESNLT